MEKKVKQSHILNLSSKKIIIIICLSVMLIITIFFIVTNNRSHGATKIIKEVSKKIRVSNRITNIVSLNEENDPEKLLGKENEYYEKVTWDDTWIQLKQVGVIELFNNSEDAKLKEWYMEESNKVCRSKINNKTYGKYADNVCKETKSYLKDNIYVEFNSNLRKQYIEEYQEAFAEVLKNHNNENKKVPSKEQINKIKERKQKEIEKKFNKVKNDLEKKLDNIADKLDQSISNTMESLQEEELKKLQSELEEVKQIDYFSSKIEDWKNKINTINGKIIEKKNNYIEEINQKLNTIMSSLDKDALSNIKKEIEDNKDAYFDSYKETWNNTIKTIETKIEEKQKQEYKNSCSHYNYNDLLRYPDNYKYKDAHFFGKVSQVITKSSGLTVMRVSVSCKTNRYASSGYVCDDAIYVTYLGDESIIEDDMIDMWGYLTGKETYTTIMGSAVTIPKFTARYITIR